MVEGPRSSFVGRTAELVLLEAALASAVARSPRTVFVGGEAGVGKTRLVTEFSTRAGADARVLTGRCFELSGGGLPYWPAVEMLRELARSLDDTARRELLEPTEAELARLLPTGDADQGWPTDPTAGSVQARFFELVRRFVGRLARRSPVVLAVEDLQWADQSTLDLLTFQVHNLHEERVLVVGTYRTDELHGSRLRTTLTELGRSERVERIELASFTRDELAAQLRGLLGTVPPGALVDRIYARSEGNAYFAEQLLAAGMGAADVELPRSLRDVIMRRFEALSEDAQDVLRVVATAGRRVSHRLVAACSELPQRVLLRALREAVAQQFLVGDPNDGTYSFRHELTREAINADMLPGDLAVLHAAVARALTEDPGLAGDQAVTAEAELAHHWQAANEPAKALAASLAAGRLAVGIYAFAEAQRQLERALELWDRVADAASVAGLTRTELLEQAADTALWTGDVDRALVLVLEALAGVDPVREPARAGVLHERRGRYLWVAGDTDGSLAAHAEADRLLASGPATPARVRALGAHGRILLITGRYSECRVRCEEAVAMARAIGAVREEGNALTSLGLSLVMLGDPDEGIAALIRARELAEENGTFEDLYRAYNNLALALDLVGRLHEAVEVALGGLETARRHGLPLSAWGGIVDNAVSELFLLGRWPEAEQLLGEARQLETTARWGPFLQLRRAELDAARGRFAEASARLDAARETPPHLADPLFVGSLRACLAELAIWQGDPSTAEASVQEGLRLLSGSEDHQSAIWLCALGLRAEADEVQQARSAGATDKVEAAWAAGAALFTRSRELIRALDGRGVVPPEVTATAKVCEAEHSRLQGRSQPERWEDAARSWEELHQPYRAAYARCRQAEALLANGGPGKTAVTILGQAHVVAVRLGAEPLRGELERLAQRHGIGLS